MTTAKLMPAGEHQLLVSKTYLSKAITDFTAHDLKQLLLNCRQSNAAAAVTGALLYHNGYFMQLIEGEVDSINATYARIQADSRHEILSVLFEDEISARFFPDWTMGYRAAEDLPMASLDVIYEVAKASTTRFPINDFLLMFGEAN